jgi:hypothetical protein
MRGFLTALLVIHGVIHVLGFAKAFGFAELPQLTAPISRPLGCLWLSAAVLMLATAFAPPRLFWIIGTLALVASQWAIVTSFHDAKLGTVVNVVLLFAIAYSFAAHGPFSLAAEYRRDASRMLAAAQHASVLTEADLAALPAPVQRYLRVTGSVGQPRIVNFRAHWKGRIRSSQHEPWMELKAEQLNSVAAPAARLFFMSAVMKGLPVYIYHRFVARDATFRVRLLAFWTMVDAKGSDMNRAETVTIFNDLCMLAPSALLDPAVRWQAVDANTARATFTRGAETVAAELRFNDAGELVDFISDDRLRASADGKTFVRQRWSTPLAEYRSFGGRRVSTQGRAEWHAPEGKFAYAELELLAIEYNLPEA